MGHRRHPHLPNATGLLICADAGGSNGYRTRLFETELAALTARTGVKIADHQMKTLESDRILDRDDFHGEWN